MVTKKREDNLKLKFSLTFSERAAPYVEAASKISLTLEGTADLERSDKIPFELVPKDDE